MDVASRTDIVQRLAVHIASTGRALPGFTVQQADVTAALGKRWPDHSAAARRLALVHRACGVDTRHFVLPLEAYLTEHGFTARNDVFLDVSVALCERAVRDALVAADVTARDVGFLMLVCTSGLAVPSLDARLMNRLPFEPGTRRLPIFGLGCAGGVAGLARCADLLRGAPSDVALLVAVEVCSLTFQPADDSPGAVVASGLFGDGAAAVVLVGEQRARAAQPRVVASRSVLHEDTEEILGWRFGAHGFQVVLQTELPDVATRTLRDDVTGFLHDHGLRLEDVSHWIVHPGGPRVLRRTAAALDLPDDALAASWRSLAECGNVSSVSALLILGDTLAGGALSGSRGLLLGMGPGFSVELVLLEWP